MSAGAFQAGTILGPVAAGFLLKHGLSTAFVAVLVAGCAVMAVLALAVERRITPAVNGITEAPSVTLR